MELYQFITIALLAAIGTQTSYLTVRKSGIRKKSGTDIIVDTSALIDGRIIAIAQTGFVHGVLVVPRSVVAELQYMADNADHDKRVRARYGLDVIRELQDMKDIEVRILQDRQGRLEVDTQLVELAKRYTGYLCTVDYNLNKVAQVEGVKVLNVNELAQALRTTHLPGERRMITLTQKGNDSHQAVGYLEDGTMVVVEQASKFIGQPVQVEFTRVLQTQAGKMMFAKRITDDNGLKQKKDTIARSQTTSRKKKPVKRPSEEQALQKPLEKKTVSPKKKTNGRQRKTNEDSLIELINRDN